MASPAAAAALKPRSSWKPLLKTAGAGFVGGIILWGAGDVLGEFTTFLKLRERGLLLANDSQELREQIGHPFSAGPWYNSSIGFTAGGNIAQCTFQLQGTKQITDVTVRGVRSQGSFNRALYNIIGPGAWTIIDCTAMFPSGGGLVQPRSLLPKQAPGQAAQDSKSHNHHHQHPAPQGRSDSVGGSEAAGIAPSTASKPDTVAPSAPKGGRTWWGWIRGKPRESNSEASTPA